MEFLIFYGLFSVAAAIAATIILLPPVLKTVGHEQPLNPVVEHWILTCTIFVCMSLLFAPAIALATVLPSMGEKFKDTLSESLLSND